ncbi:probable ATP-dependent RNA helicase DDX27 [Oncorhynchus keta]|uniref:probable ATP-dependent RNA helicase DDX27 n=1 Tax=Oncorhynchus keta TaxID=8018 RepID=UPI00227CFE21|nr:probable ATP-dependent RNA helicase DDX27 [Oncorhynchus keta]
MCVSCLCVFCVCFLCLCLCFSALLTQTFQDHVMVFTQTKKQAHRMHILLGLMGLKVGELHGNLSQTQKTEEPQVINFTMPNTMKTLVGPHSQNLQGGSLCVHGGRDREADAQGHCQEGQDPCEFPCHGTR